MAFHSFSKGSEGTKQLLSLVKKCPRWEETISTLAESNENYRHFSYKQMEKELSQREFIKTAWNILEILQSN